ncbi:hypothetical protein SUDANB6_05950 [Streptomyces sp. enrichment culture]
MRASGIERGPGSKGVRLRRRHRTTVPDPAATKAPDLIRRDFTADKPNTKYVGDITYLPIDGGKFCYLATVIDLASRRPAGWAIADHMRADLVTDALAAAVRTRGTPTGSITHTDHGAPYTSRAFTEACSSAGVRQSMSAARSSADNALTESFDAAFEREPLQGRKSCPRRARGPRRRLQTAPPLQHPAPTLPPRTAITNRLRDRPPSHTNYADTSRITRVQYPGSRPTLVRVAGRRWTIEETFQPSKTLTGLDEHQVRRWTTRHRWVTLAMLAHAFPAAITANEPSVGQSPDKLVPLTRNEIQRLFTTLSTQPHTTSHRLRWSLWRRRHQATARACHYARQTTRAT